jgi:hypothetical protein
MPCTFACTVCFTLRCFCFRNTVAVGTFLASNYVSIADGASVSGAVLTSAGIAISHATIVLQRGATPSSTGTASLTSTLTSTRTQSGTPSATQNPSTASYTTKVNMLGATSFVLIAGTGLTNTVRHGYVL